MQKFSEFIKEHKSILENQSKQLKIQEFDSLYQAKLKEMGVKSVMDLDEKQQEAFNQYIKEIKASLNKSQNELESKKLNEKKITDEKSFREYAESVLRKAHGDKYDEDIAKKVIDDIIDKVGDDWGEAVGRLTSGLGS